MDCKRQEAKRLGSGLQIRFSGFDSRLAVHFCGPLFSQNFVVEKPQPQAKIILSRYDPKSFYHATVATGSRYEVSGVFLLPTVISGSLMLSTLMPIVLCDKIPLPANCSLCTHIVSVQYSLTALILIIYYYIYRVKGLYLDKYDYIVIIKLFPYLYDT